MDHVHTPAAWRRSSMLAALLCLTLALSGCTSTLGQLSSTGSAATLPPAAQPYSAPVGDASLDYTALVDLYLPSMDGTHLVAQQAQLTLNRGRHPAETVLRALFTYEGNRQVQALGGTVRLQLAGVNPVEISCGVCTVTLAASALQLNHDAFYAVCQAIASTLAPFGISHVNILISGMAVAMDITASLPLGSITARPEADLADLWNQLDSRKPALGEDASQVSLTSTATLFFPTLEGTGLLAEPRDISFVGQTPAQLASGLISALSAGPQVLTSAAPMPDLNTLLLYAPQIRELQDTGGRIAMLYFCEDLEDRLRNSGLDMAGFLGSVTYTLAAFIPSLTAVECYVGGSLLTSVLTAENRMLTFPDGRMTRGDFAAYLKDVALLYFVQGDRLVASPRPVPYYEVKNPRYLLLQLMAGPTVSEAAAGRTSLLPAYLGDADILGFSAQDGVLLVNLSPSFATSSSSLDETQERLLAYSMINTLCHATELRRIRFYFGGEPWDTVAGSLWWNGEFMENTSMVQP